MRDPKRIRVFCNRLAAAWETMPDIRFGQLIENVRADIQHERDMFYVEDDEMINLIEQKCQSMDEVVTH